jgi:hypothetical protein
MLVEFRLEKSSRILLGLVLMSMPTIELGGYFLLQLLQGQHQQLAITGFQQSFFRAGHAHAGILTVLNIIAIILTDQICLHHYWKWFIRIAMLSAALLISGGFFAAVAHSSAQTTNSAIVLVFLGAGMLASGLLVLGVGLIRSAYQKK